MLKQESIIIQESVIIQMCLFVGGVGGACSRMADNRNHKFIYFPGGNLNYKHTLEVERGKGKAESTAKG